MEHKINATTTTTIQTAQLQAVSRKVFARTGGEPLYPTFTNSIEFTGVGMDIFMDVGVIAPESLQAAVAQKTTATPPTVDFMVSYRFGMTLQTAMQLHANLTSLIEAAKRQIDAAGAAPVGKSEQ